MSWVAAAVVGGAAISGVVAHKAAGDAADAQTEAAQLGIGEQQAAREQAQTAAQPFVDIGLSAGDQLQSLISDPTQQLSEINPVVDFLRNQGFEQIQESAAAQGRLGAGGTLKDLTQFNTDLTSTIVPQLQNQRFNQLFNVLGLGQNAAAGQGSAALQTGTNISNLLGNVGQAQAGAQIGQANAISGGLQNIASGIGAFGGGLGGSPGSGYTPVPNSQFSTATNLTPQAIQGSGPLVF